MPAPCSSPPCPPVTVGPEETADPLGSLLDRAAGLAADDVDGWRHLRALAVTVTEPLVTTGRLPAHLAVGRDDPAVLVARTLAVAHRRLDAREDAGRGPR